MGRMTVVVGADASVAGGACDLAATLPGAEAAAAEAVAEMAAVAA